MAIALADEHQELTRVATAFLESNAAREASRALLEAQSEPLPAFWKEMAALGWMGLHIDEAHGGQGFGLPELSVVVEALGFALAPGPFLPSAVAAAAIAEAGSAATREAFLPGLADGSRVGGVGLGGDLSWGRDRGLEGSAGLVLGGELAHLIVVCVEEDLAVLAPDQPGVSLLPQKNVDPSRRVVEIRCEGVEVPDASRLPGARRALVRLARTLAAAEAAGAARACTEMATAYARERVQFGRPIGTFGPVKHHCANMLVATEQATAGAWNAARAGARRPTSPSSPRRSPCSLALPASAFCAQSQNIQVHGGIGYTWEHDAHLYLRRAIALESLDRPRRSRARGRGAAHGARRAHAGSRWRCRPRRSSSARRPAPSSRVSRICPKEARGARRSATAATWSPTGRSPGAATRSRSSSS